MGSVVEDIVATFRESTVTQFTLVVLVFGTISFCVVANHAIPPELWGFGGLVMGYFFRTKAKAEADKS